MVLQLAHYCSKERSVDAPVERDDLFLRLTVLHLVTSRNLMPEEPLRKRVTGLFSQAEPSVLRGCDGPLVDVLDDAINKRDLTLATAVANARIKAATHLLNEAKLAEANYMMGNKLAAIDPLTAAEFWRMSVHGFAKAQGRNYCEVGALNAYAWWLNKSVKESDIQTARDCLWRSFRLITTNKEIPDSLLVNWCRVAAEFTEKNDRNELARILKLVVDDAPSLPFRLHDDNSRFEARVVYASLLNALRQTKEGRLEFGKLINLARQHKIKPLLILEAYTVGADLYIGTSTGLNLWNKLLAMQAVETLPRERLSDLYMRAANAYREYTHGTLLKNQRELPEYAAFMQKSSELRGMSSSWSRKFVMAWSLAERCRSVRAALLLEELLSDQESHKLSEKSLHELRTKQIECYLSSGSTQKASELLNRFSSSTLTRSDLVFATTLYFEAKEYDKAKEMFLRRLARDSVDQAFAKKYVEAVALLRCGRLRESATLFETILDRAILELQPYEVGDLYVTYAAATVRDKGKDYARKLVQRAVAVSGSPENSEVWLLSLVYEAGGLYDDARALMLRLRDSPELEATSPAWKRTFYKELSNVQRLMNLLVDAEASSRIAETFVK